ncbi:hypothetical protein [Nonomuraea sp. NPDC048916]|uniref:hypothetical protein n=1 Tax=Nonomuraea sp. NPDC048916 TaxID=3154232 RepID=UPI0034100EF2
MRVRDHTCDCQAVFYELCQAGGLRFIRRTSRKGGRMVVDESPWVIAAEAEALWRRLLEGRAQ